MEKICSKNSRSKAKSLAQPLSDLYRRMLYLRSGEIQSLRREQEADPNWGLSENE